MEIIRIFCRKGENEKIRYAFYQTLFGPALIASTSKGICFLAFGEEEKTLPALKKQYPAAIVKNQSDAFQMLAQTWINGEASSDDALPLHIGGSAFQMAVWESLLDIPFGEFCTYRQIAVTIGKPKAWRAVASAIGKNPVAYLIPCHRVIRSDGRIGGYRWGIGFKQKMLEQEELRRKCSPDYGKSSEPKGQVACILRFNITGTCLPVSSRRGGV